MWAVEKVIIFEGENEAELKARFVELCARYPERNFFEVGEYVFKDLRDPVLRGQQAGSVWGKDLDILERIAKARRQGGYGNEDEVPAKDQIAIELVALARDEKVEVKDRVTAYFRAAEILGYVEKNVNKKVEDKTARGMPVFQIARYPDDATAN